MNFLLDSHCFIWTVCDTKKIPDPVIAVLKDPAHRVFVSAVSLWEIALKHAMGKLTLNRLTPDQLRMAALEMGFELIALEPEDASSFNSLPRVQHKDPFDRMLAWQAIRGNYLLVSCDQELRAYASNGLQLFWPIG